VKESGGEVKLGCGLRSFVLDAACPITCIACQLPAAEALVAFHWNRSLTVADIAVNDAGVESKSALSLALVALDLH